MALLLRPSTRSALTVTGVVIGCAVLVLVIVLVVLVSTKPCGETPAASKAPTVLGVSGRGGLGGLDPYHDDSRPHPVSLASSYKVQDQRVWPFPNSVTKGTSVTKVSVAEGDVSVSGPGAGLLHPSVLQEFRAFVRSGESSGRLHPKPHARASRIRVVIASDGVDGSDESYALVIQPGQDVVLTAPQYVGAVYGLQTLQQLIRGGDTVANTPMTIRDAPRTPFRGLMLDCARNFLPLGTLLAQVRAMAFHKLNFLHLHLTDGQSFPVGVGPHTTAIAAGSHQGNTGAFSPRETYSRRDVAALVEYAFQRGVKVVPEIDSPGHAYSWISGHPDIMACASAADQYQAVCPEPPCGFLNLRDKLPAVKRVVQGVLAEVADVFRVGAPGYSPYLHLGFDEVGCPSLGPGGVCTKPSCTEAFGGASVTYGNWMLQWAREALLPSARVLMWVDQVLTSNFSPEGEYSSVLEVDPEFVTLQFWNLDARTPGLLRDLAGRGFSLVNSQASVYYLDAGGEGNGVFWGGPIASEAFAVQYQKYWMAAYSDVGGLLPNGWPTSWEDIYQNNPGLVPTTLGADPPAPPAYVSLPMAKSLAGPGVLGVCACAWGEQIDATNIDTRVWPKASALAEALWRYDPDRMPDTVPNARMRIAYAREDVLRLGIAAAPVVAGDLFRRAPWGPIGPGSATDLMYDINGPTPQRPGGYTLTFRRWWGAASACGAPLNPYCGTAKSKTVSCTNPDAAPYPQQGCP